MEEALKFASEQLAERGEESELVLEELERTLALLAFEDPEKSPYGDLLSYSHRQKVRYILNRSLQVLMTRNLRIQLCSFETAAWHVYEGKWVLFKVV